MPARDVGREAVAERAREHRDPERRAVQLAAGTATAARSNGFAKLA